MKSASSERNVLILGVSVLFLVVFSVYFEITKSVILIYSYSEPSSSLSRGIEAAERDFFRGRKDFKLSFDKRGDLGFLGLDEDNVQKTLGYVPAKYVSHSCIVIAEGYESWVVPEDYKSNDFYVVGYNRRMLDLLSG